MLLQFQKMYLIDKIDNIVDKFNNTYHSATSIRPADVKSSTYIDFSIETIDKDPKFKVDDHVVISRYKKTAKGYTTNWSVEIFVNKNVTVPQIYVKRTLTEKKLLGHFYEKEQQKTNQTESRIGKVIKKEGDTLYVKQKCSNNSFNGWVYKKDIII